jgi:ABC-type antimicrobial peptide transport system permease subunit
MFFRLLREGFIFAFKSDIVNKLRTFLSLFGITIGIFSIISVFTVLDWMQKSIHESISTLGDNVLYVQKFPWGLNTKLPWSFPVAIFSNLKLTINTTAPLGIVSGFLIFDFSKILI